MPCGGCSYYYYITDYMVSRDLSFMRDLLLFYYWLRRLLATSLRPGFELCAPPVCC